MCIAIFPDSIRRRRGKEHIQHTHSTNSTLKFYFVKQQQQKKEKQIRKVPSNVCVCVEQTSFPLKKKAEITNWNICAFYFLCRFFLLIFLITKQQQQTFRTWKWNQISNKKKNIYRNINSLTSYTFYIYLDRYIFVT